jgi:uncharacterized membrane protein
MDRMLVVVFDSESQAYEGSRTLQELQGEGSIKLYSKAVIARDLSGRVAVMQAGNRGPVGTAVGLLTGGLIGLLVGPVALAIGAGAGTVGRLMLLGLALGAGAGIFWGMLYDLGKIRSGEEFLHEVGNSLKPGKAAVVAEVWKECVLPVDTRMEALGGVVFRGMRRDILEAQIEGDVAALKAELAKLEAERDQATGEAKASLQAKIDAARDKLQAMQDGIQARIEASKQETEAKIKSLQEQAAGARGDR